MKILKPSILSHTFDDRILIIQHNTNIIINKMYIKAQFNKKMKATIK